MLAHGILNQFDPAHPIIEQRSNQVIVVNISPRKFRQCSDPTTGNLTTEVFYNGNWYVVSTFNFATDVAAAAAGTYARSTIAD